MPRSRREFLTRAGLFAAGASLSAPALADPSPEVRWTMTSAFQPSLDLIYDGARTCAAAVSGHHGWEFRYHGAARGRKRSCNRSLGGGRRWEGGLRAYRAFLLLDQGASLLFRFRRPVRDERPAACGVAAVRGRKRIDRRSLG